VTTELNGTISIRRATTEDLATAALESRSTFAHGTVVELRVPTMA
jgi:hypothetical protein